MKRIDCRNMACPAPVMNVRKALEAGGALAVLLDDGAPRENVGRFARSRGMAVDEQCHGGHWELTITPPGTPQPSSLPTGSTAPSFLITSDRLGDGPEELGRLLMKNMIHTLIEAEHLPERMMFLNSGVMLTTEGSEVLEALRRLSEMGVEILSCGLCLDYFGLKEKLKAGGTTNMLSTVEAMLDGTGIIKL